MPRIVGREIDVHPTRHRSHDDRILPGTGAGRNAPAEAVRRDDVEEVAVQVPNPFVASDTNRVDVRPCLSDYRQRWAESRLTQINFAAERSHVSYR